MKKNRIICLILSLIMILSMLPTFAYGTQPEDDASVSAGCHGVDAAKTLSDDGKLVDTSKAVILYELNSGTMLYTYNPDQKIYPTSMVKLMTVLVALEIGDLEEKVTVTRKALSSVAVGAVVVGLKSGEELTLEDLLYCTMTASANDAAAVVAEHIAGSQDAFVQLMNEKAQALGCLGTHYGNALGLHDEQTYTTARDICRITVAALKNEKFKEIFQASGYTVAETNKSKERNLETTNKMALENSKYYDERVTGGKTGATNQGGRCLTLTAHKDGMDLLCIVMGAEPTYLDEVTLSRYGSFEECAQLLDYAFSGYAYRQVFFDGQAISQYPVQGGDSDVVTQPTASASTLLPVKGDQSLLRWVYIPTESVIQAPVQKGQALGVVQVWYGEKCLAQTQMVAMNQVAVESAPVVPEKPENEDDGGNWKILLVLLGVFAGMLGILIVVFVIGRIIGNITRKTRRRRRRRNRERRRIDAGIGSSSGKM